MVPGAGQSGRNGRGTSIRTPMTRRTECSRVLKGGLEVCEPGSTTSRVKRPIGKCTG